MCHQGADYRAGSKIKQGFINGVSQLNYIMDKCPPLDAYSDEDLDNYITGVILVSQYSLKKGMEQCRDKAE